MQVQREEDFRKYGLIGTVILHTLLILAFIFAVFSVPDPPLEGGSGVDLQYGVIGDEGFGDIQTTAPPNNSPNTEESRPAPVAPQVAKEQVQAPVEEVKASEERIVTTDEESPVNIKPVEKPVEKPEPKVEKPKEEVKETPKAVALYPGKSKVENGVGGTGTSSTPAGNNTGDKPGKVGDQGAPDGSMTGTVYTGKPGSGGGGSGGSGGGANLNMPGWHYDVRPKQDPYENEAGKIVFQITIDANGEINNVKKLESNVSPQVEKWYRDQIFKTTFSRTNKEAADQGATGTITFIIRSR